MKIKNIIVLRGLGREQRHAQHFIDLLKNNNYNVFGLDQMGSGTEYSKEVPERITDSVIDLRRRFLKIQKEHEGPWMCIALSMGGMMALEWQNLFPIDFRKIYLINSSSSDLSPFYKRLRPQALLQVTKLLNLKNLVEREEALIKLTTNLVKTEDKIKMLAKEWAFYAEQSPISKLNFAKQLLNAKNFKRPKHLNCELKILVSLKDKVCHPDCSFDIANCYNTPIFTHTEAGHDLMIDDPEWILKKLNEE